ncbi:MAG: PorT family protein [Bacteroidales bacterium]|nr:PorT family protein [Bacteroidales bacterium]
MVFSISIMSQVIDDQTKRKFSIGIDVFTDIWQDLPKGMDTRTINQGTNIYGMYNYIFGKSNFSFSPGIGIGVHNLYNNTLPQFDLANDSTAFVIIPDSISYKRSKLTTSYFDIPVEIRFKSKKELRFAIGFKFGFLIKMYSKFKGDDPAWGNSQVIHKTSRIRYAEKNRYGFIARFGYKWINFMGYYSLSALFQKGKGPEMYPISVGVAIIPF